MKNAMKRLMKSRSRLRAHLSDGGNVFIPQWRMREIRWEEAVANSRLKRFPEEDVRLVHSTCHCGSIGCIAVPIYLRK